MGKQRGAYGAGIFVSRLDKLARHLVCIHVYRIKQAVVGVRSLVWSCALGLGYGKV